MDEKIQRLREKEFAEARLYPIVIEMPRPRVTHDELMRETQTRIACNLARRMSKDGNIRGLQRLDEVIHQEMQPKAKRDEK